jgi:hypothetical protein
MDTVGEPGVSPRGPSRCRYPRRRLPSSGSLGTSVPHLPDQESCSRPAVLCSATTANGPPRGRSVLPLLPRSLGSRLWLCVPWSRKARVKGGRFLSTPGVLPTLGGTPTPDLSPRRPLALPSSRVTPGPACSALRPRWCPEHSPCRIQDCCLPVTAHRRLSLATALRTILLTTTLHISGLNDAAYMLVPSSFVRPLLGVHVACTTDLLARLWSGGICPLRGAPTG